MILRKILDLYEKRREFPRGNPTGSRFGTCLAQLQLLQYPDLSRPEPRPARSMMVMEQGNQIERWWSETIEQAYPSLSGLTQEVFYIRVTLPSERAVDDVRRKIESRTLWGRVLPKFSPPAIREEAGRVKLRLLPCPACAEKGYDHGWPCGKKLGLVLVPEASEAWVPTFVDRIIKHDELGLVVAEKKAVSNYAFRRALLGEIDYGKRAQLAGIAEATGLDTVLLLCRKETMHLLEVAYLRRAGGVTVRLLRSNRQEEVYRVHANKLVQADGTEIPVPHDTEWEAAAVETPYDPALMHQIRQRVLAALLYQPGQEPQREAGPSFVCPTCQGTGIQTLAKGTGKPLKTPKPCEGCDRGQLAEAALPSFPCGYCPVIAHCWDRAKPRLEVTERPRWLIRREDWEASGLTFTPPEGAIPEPEEATA